MYSCHVIMASLKRLRMEASFSRFLVENEIFLLTVECLEREHILTKRDFCDVDVVELMLFSNRGVPIGQISKLRIMYAEMKGLQKSSADAPTVAALSSQKVQRSKNCNEGRPQQSTQSPPRLSTTGQQPGI